MRKLLLVQRYAILTLLGLITIFAIPLSLSIAFDSEKSGMSQRRGPASAMSDSMAGVVSVDNYHEDSQKSSTGEVTWPLPVKNIDCGQAQDLGSVEGDMVRLKVRECDGFAPVRITNTTNGYASDAILTRKGEYTSDYVDLKFGSNKIEVIRTSADGNNTTQTVTIERRIRQASADE